MGKTASLLSQYFIDFLLSASKESLDNLLKQIKLFSNEIFDPNYKRRKTSMGTMYDLLGVNM